MTSLGSRQKATPSAAPSHDVALPGKGVTIISGPHAPCGSNALRLATLEQSSGGGEAGGMVGGGCSGGAGMVGGSAQIGRRIFEYPATRKLRPVVQHGPIEYRTWKVVTCSSITMIARCDCCGVRLYESAGLSPPTP